MTFQYLAETILDHPVDLDSRCDLVQIVHDGKSMDNIAQGRCFDDQYAHFRLNVQDSMFMVSVTKSLINRSAETATKDTRERWPRQHEIHHPPQPNYGCNETFKSSAERGGYTTRCSRAGAYA